MNKPTISARSDSLPRRSLCQWVDTVTAETSGEGFYENKLKEVEVSAVFGAEPTRQLGLRQDGVPGLSEEGADPGRLGLQRSTWP